MRHDTGDDADLTGALGVDALAGEQQFHRRLPADALGQALGTDDRRDAQAHLGEPERGPLAGDHEVAPGDQGQPVAQAVPVHRGDHRFVDLPAALEGVDGGLLPERARELAGGIARGPDVCSGAERPT